ncbi:MAG: GHKL domain-containing protein, partial [Vagococcus sp.]|uniref:GHKL domain-containing protein n=1 Tax=Vagococcus sp. TaxID=1933889 RepID=UPI002FC7DBC2
EEILLQDSPDKFINIAVIDQSDNIEIIIKNSLAKPSQHFQHLVTTNYSTKKEHSGLGLATVKNFVEENPQINLYATIDNKKLVFSITLLIEKS